MVIFNQLSHFAAGCSHPAFFGLKPWYQYLDTNSDCTIHKFNVLSPDGSSDFMKIGLVLVDDLLQVAGLVAIAFVIYGGFLYMTSEGAPDQAQKAQNTIKNALIGLTISILAIAFVQYIGNSIG